MLTRLLKGREDFFVVDGHRVYHHAQVAIQGEDTGGGPRVEIYLRGARVEMQGEIQVGETLPSKSVRVVRGRR